MQTWLFTEDAYLYLPEIGVYKSINVNLTNKHYAPAMGSSGSDVP